MTYAWITVEEAIALHNKIIERFGGSSGILDNGLLDSALARPQNLACYSSDASIFELAAAYGFGLTKNHCFVDGNKRTAFVVMTVFLLRNGYELVVPEPEAVSVMVSLAKSELSQEELATWIFSNILALPS